MANQKKNLNIYITDKEAKHVDTNNIFKFKPTTFDK